jgi:hypothetical protein
MISSTPREGSRTDVSCAFWMAAGLDESWKASPARDVHISRSFLEPKFSGVVGHSNVKSFCSAWLILVVRFIGLVGWILSLQIDCIQG